MGAYFLGEYGMRKWAHDIRYWPPRQAGNSAMSAQCGSTLGHDQYGTHLRRYQPPRVEPGNFDSGLGFGGFRRTARNGGQSPNIVLAACCLAGRALPGGRTKTVSFTAISAISFLISGALVAADLRLKRGTVATIAVVLGFCDGYINGISIRPTGSGYLDLVGAIAAIFVAVAIVAAFVIRLRRPWTRVAIRVVGSWIAATGLLLLGWSVHSG